MQNKMQAKANICKKSSKTCCGDQDDISLKSFCGAEDDISLKSFCGAEDDISSKSWHGHKDNISNTSLEEDFTLEDWVDSMCCVSSNSCDSESSLSDNSKW